MSQITDSLPRHPFATEGIRQRLRRFGQGESSTGEEPDKRLRWDPHLDAMVGRGVRIALLDSGLRWELPMFRGAAIDGRDFTGARELRDPTGHGTASASLLVGQAEGGLCGLAPRAELLCARVLSARREVTLQAIERAIAWSVEKGAQILVMPFGSRRGAAPVARAVRRAAHAGVTVVAAAGNSGRDVICFPAWLDEVTAVTGADATGRSLPHCCSTALADLAAPGERVVAIGPQGPMMLCGSSPAAVLAAGAFALERGRAVPPAEPSRNSWLARERLAGTRA
jgi:subtilisin family serine protease